MVHVYFVCILYMCILCQQRADIQRDLSDFAHQIHTYTLHKYTAAAWWRIYARNMVYMLCIMHPVDCTWTL